MNSQRGYDDRYNDRNNRDSLGSSVIQSRSPDTVSFRRFSASQFNGDDCLENRQCEEQCEEIFNTSNACKNLPEDMIDLLHQHYVDLKNIRFSNRQSGSRNNEDVNHFINPSAFATLIYYDSRNRQRLIRLPERDWSDTQTKQFLMAVASNKIMVQAVQDTDSSLAFFEESLNRFSRDIVRVLSIDLDRYRDTFLSIAERSQNVFAFEFIFDLLNDRCTDSLQCKSLLLCQREVVDQRGRSTTFSCPYVSANSRDRREHCYIHGLDVWSYLKSQMDQGHIRDNDLRNIEVNEPYCDTFCRNHDCAR